MKTFYLWTTSNKTDLADYMRERYGGVVRTVNATQMLECAHSDDFFSHFIDSLKRDLERQAIDFALTEDIMEVPSLPFLDWVAITL